MGSCLDRFRNENEEECCGLIQGILSSILCRWCCCCRPNQNEEERTLISCGKSQLQSSSAVQEQVTGNTCSSGSEDPGDRNIDDGNTDKSSSNKESQNTGEINSGESQHDIKEREEKNMKGDIKEESSSNKESQNTGEINSGESQHDIKEREEKNMKGDIKKESSSNKESQNTGEINSGESQHDIKEREEKNMKGDIKEESPSDNESKDTGKINSGESRDADENEENDVNRDIKKESSSAKRNRDAEIDLIVLSPLPEGVKRFYKALEENLRKVRIREVTVNDFMEDKTGKNLVIVICNITTRALSDVTATLDKIKDDMHQRIFLICLHWKNPTEAAVSAAENIVKRYFPSIKETVDMVYYRIKDKEGLHTCDLNEKALKTIKKHIRDGNFRTK